jgi:Xaa-Pro aminopeptidase
MPHYRATPESHAVIEGDGLLLIDSGGQYLGGTTDITRVWPIGTRQRGDEARLHAGAQGHDGAVARALPARHAVPMLDAIARAPLWAEGHRLRPRHRPWRGLLPAVHEGPQSISKARPSPDGDGARHDHLHRARRVPPGPVGRAHREPGAQRAGHHGPRATFGEFLEFETLTLCPIDTRCIDRALLRADEIAWLNAYHATVRERLRRVSAARWRWPGCRRAPQPL